VSKLRGWEILRNAGISSGWVVRVDERERSLLVRMRSDSQSAVAWYTRTPDGWKAYKAWTWLPGRWPTRIGFRELATKVKDEPASL